MTAAGLERPPGAVPREGAVRLTRTGAVLRLIGLHLASRRVPGALLMIALCGAAMRAALYWRWTLGTGNAAQQVPLILEAGTALAIAATTTSPFGEPERATGRWLPYLRLGTALALTGIAIGVLCAGAADAGLSGGTLDILRNVAGQTGVGLLLAFAIGGGLAWAGPVAYMLMAEFGLHYAWTTPWIWPARPPHDRGAAICAALVFVAGIVAITVRGARDSARE
jgi:hypothetical protein